MKLRFPPSLRTWLVAGVTGAFAAMPCLLNLADFSQRSGLVLLGLAGLVLLLGAWLAGDALILRRLESVARAADRISNGDFAARARLRGQDEIARLGAAFDRMAGEMENRIVDLRTRTAAVEERLVTAVLDRAREIGFLSTMADLLMACGTRAEVYRVAARSAGELFPGDRGILYAVDADGRLLRAAATFGTFPPEAPPQDVPTDECWTLRCTQTHTVLPVAGALSCRHGGDASDVCVCLPLVAQGRVLGVLQVLLATGDAAALASDPRTALAAVIAGQCAFALAGIALRETLREQSHRDPLTTLYNRRALEETLEREIKRAARTGVPVAIALFDIDLFKGFNDRHGHEIGDAALVEVAAHLVRRVRGGDLCARWGGEEFVVVFAGASLADARERTEEMRRALAARTWRHGGRTYEPITLSAGVAAFPVHGGDPAALLRAADRALYEAKARGRNRVEVAVSPAPVPVPATATAS